MRRLALGIAALAGGLVSPPSPARGQDIWRDPSQPTAVRVADLLGRLTLAEKISLMRCDCPAIPRLGIPSYSHRTEALHGLVNDDVTVFPQAIGMAATWDTALVHDEADAIATEIRAKSNAYAAAHGGDRGYRFGLTCYAPNLNIFRDPRWGRGQETYGEDPFLTSRLGVAFIRGMQGDDPTYIKVIAGAKHYVVHSGPERGRHGFAVYPPERDLYETYLPAFEAAVREGRVGSVMAAHSAVFGIPNCENVFLLTDLLRKTWGFDGFVVTDGGAIYQAWAAHKYAATPAEAAADALNAGCDIASGGVAPGSTVMRDPANWARQTSGHDHGGEDYDILPQALAEGLTTEGRIDEAVSRELTARFRVGLFDPPERVPWSKLTRADCDTPEHRELALRVAGESLVLLENRGILPLDRTKLRRIAVIGPNAASERMLLGNYEGKPSRDTTILDGIRRTAGSGIAVDYAEGCPLALKGDGSNRPSAEMTAAAVAAAKSADVTIFVGGIDSTLEREEADNQNVQGFDGGDRTRIELPQVQLDLIQTLWALGKPMVLVNCSGSAMALRWETDHLGAILQAWYPGEEGGRAVAQALFGEINPSGRLPVTFYRSTEELPPFADYSMADRTYRYFDGSPLYAFGHGLSYTTFTYSDPKFESPDHVDPKLESAEMAKDETARVSFTIENSGARDGAEVAQVYFRHVGSAATQPRLALCGFTRIEIGRGEAARVTIDIPAERLRYWDTGLKRYVVERGAYELLIGAASDDIRLRVPLRVY